MVHGTTCIVKVFTFILKGYLKGWIERNNFSMKQDLIVSMFVGFKVLGFRV